MRDEAALVHRRQCLEAIRDAVAGAKQMLDSMRAARAMEVSRAREAGATDEEVSEWAGVSIVDLRS